MCGIAGYLDFDNKINLTTLYKMTNVIRYRGPDDEGYLLHDISGSIPCFGEDSAKECLIKDNIKSAPERAGQCYLGFGHRRLSIIDLSAAGHQPMEDSEKELSITYNGEIYNYLEVREELKKKGCYFCTNTDTEVVLKAYRIWGEDCVAHFNGMWAFAIYDRKAEKLFCSRDRLGAKPFYYYRKGNHFVFGSEIKQLCQDEQLERRMNDKYLVSTLLLRIQDYSEETLLSDVYALPGGCNLILSLDVKQGCILDMKKVPYWDLEITRKKEKKNLWYKKIGEAVRLRMRSDAPIGVMVSGGVDSTFLLNEICRYKSRNDKNFAHDLDTFTSCYKNANAHDETYYAHQVNSAWKTKEHLIYPNEKNTLAAYKKMIWHYEDYAPFSTLGSFMTLKEVAKSGVKVVINGQGGDESMLGYERYYAYYLKDLIMKNPLKGLKEAQSIIKNSRLSSVQLLAEIFYFGIPKLRIAKNRKSAKKLLQKSFVKKFSPNEVLPVLQNKSLDEMIYKEIRKIQLPHILRMDDRGYMAYSMESRVPFIDYQYLEEVVKLSPKKKIQKGFTKYLLRKKMEGTIPDEVVWRKNKNGWSSPSERWVERFDKAEVEDMMKKPLSGKYFNMNYVRKQWKKNPTGKDIEAFFFTEAFMREFEITG